MRSTIASFHLRPKSGVIQETGKDGLMSRWSKTGEMVGHGYARILSAFSPDRRIVSRCVLALHAVVFPGFTTTGRESAFSRVEERRW